MKGNIFQRVQHNKPRYSSFNLSHEVKLTLPFGALVPTLVQEIIPGDKFHINTEQVLRFAPLMAPLMHRVDVYHHFWFVPNRLVWDSWENFITGGEEGEFLGSNAPVIPFFPASNSIGAAASLFGPGSLADYMGIPCLPLAEWDEVGSTAATPEFQALPFRAYQLIYNEWYRDQNLEPKIPIDKGDGNSPNSDMLQLRYRCYEKDYFTSALPTPQKGPDINVPLSGSFGNIVTNDAVTNKAGLVKVDPFYQVLGGTINRPTLDDRYVQNKGYNPVGTQNAWRAGFNATGDDPSLPGTTYSYPAYYDPNGTLTVNSSGSGGFSITDFRNAISLKRFFERNMRSGTRYTEFIKSHFPGVNPKDARLQRPEYLGGGSNVVNISEVLQKSQTTTDISDLQPSSPQGQMTGHGLAFGNTNKVNASFTEHGYVIGIMSVLPKNAYINSLDRHWSRKSQTDYFFPEFAHIGEQEVLKQEVSYNFKGNSDVNGNRATFGYQDRYSEYKFAHSRVCGNMRNTLDFWHLARKFPNDASPNLNANFINTRYSADDLSRIFAVSVPETSYQKSAHHFYCQLYHNIKAVRPIPFLSTPH